MSPGQGRVGCGLPVLQPLLVVIHIEDAPVHADQVAQVGGSIPQAIRAFLGQRGEGGPDNHDGVITHLEPDILNCEVKWAFGSITMKKASGGDGIPVELFQILKDDALQVLHSICQQIWKTQQWPQD